MGVAAEWGTAVVVQRMVFGNLSRESGSGVTFTRNPLEPYSSQVRLFGDFTVRSQGEDLVGGLVFPWPISEAQRLGSPTYQGIEHSLERDFPEVYQALLRWLATWSARREHEPQEIEFTFESASGEDLYMLQKRPMVHEQQDDAPYFDALLAALRRRRSLWAWACPAAPTPDGWPSTWSRSTALAARRRTTPSCCCAPTPSRRTSP